jgi:hypothetical protein
MDHQDADYYEFFYWTVAAGVTCGLMHPVEWLINAWRTPGCTLPPEHYESCRKHTPRYLCDIFDFLNMRRAENANEVLEMCDKHYPEGHMCKGFFERTREELDRYIKEQIHGLQEDSGEEQDTGGEGGVAPIRHRHTR